MRRFFVHVNKRISHNFAAQIFLSMQRKKTTIFLLSFFILLAAVFMTYFYNVTRKPKTLPVLSPEGHKVTAFSFINQDGQTITEKDVKGKIFVVEYFFTTCKGICPKMNENMTKVYAAFKGNDDVKILSHTVDPKKDTVGAMKAYSTRFDADPKQWMFLTGGKQELYNMARYSYLINAVDDTSKINIESDFIHSEKFILVDRYMQIRGIYDGTDMGSVNQLIGDVKELLKEEQ